MIIPLKARLAWVIRRRASVLAAGRADEDLSWDSEPSEVLGLNLDNADIPRLAAKAGMEAEEFRRQLRRLKSVVRMDVFEHSDGVWEIVYGPSYTKGNAAAPIRRPDGSVYHPRVLADLPDVEVLQRLRTANVSALLYGPPGTGKTSLAGRERAPGGITSLPEPSTLR